MAYVLKYELYCKSRLNNQYKLRLLFDGYSGAEINRDMSESPLHLSKDKAGVIKGTSLQFSIREQVDFEFLEFYTNNSKFIKAELYLGSSLLWSGYVLSQQYQAQYKPAPCSIVFTASDGLGLLKNEDFTLTGDATQLDIIRHCIDKIGLNLGYSIATDLFETTHSHSYTCLAQTKEDASIYSEDNCYEVLEKILGKYNAEISQCGGRWKIVSATAKKGAPLLYSYNGTYESAGSAPSVLDLGYPGTGIEVSPVGILNQSMQSGGKKVKITHNYGRKDSMLSNYDFIDYTAGSFTGWTKNGTFDVLQRNHESGKYALLKTFSNSTTDYIQQSISYINANGDDFGFEIDIAPLGYLAHGYGLINRSAVTMTVKMLVYLWDGGSGFYYLGTDGWETTFTNIEIYMPSSVYKPSFVPVKVITGSPPCSGTLFVRLYRFQAVSEPTNTKYEGIAYTNVKLYPLAINQLLPESLEINAVFDESTEPLALSDIDISAADAPNYDNAVNLYRNITKRSDGSPTTLWHRSGSSDENSLITQLAMSLASCKRVARQELKGIIKGSAIGFDSIIKHAYNDNREFEIQEGTWHLYEENWTVTLAELLAWSDESVTIDVLPLDPDFEFLATEAGEYISNETRRRILTKIF